MGMFDYYRPKPDVSCPVCGASDLNWQGKDGPRELFVWEQGHAAPVDQLVDDECKVPPQERATKRLRSQFEIYAACRCPTLLDAIGTTEQGVWVKTELASPTNPLPYPGESEREFQERRSEYAKHPGHAR
jgi:hypothetical protein